jgi:hypothetical protein
MKTVFSYIIQKRLSQENENIATEALAFILDASEPARNGLMKLLRGIAPELPSLRFRTQQTEGQARPDMWGFDGETPRVFIENKFWAGFTDNQPVEYLKLLAGHPSPAVLLMVVPMARLETAWLGLRRRLEAADVMFSVQDSTVNIPHVVSTDSGPTLALTSWAKVLSAVEAELADQNAEDTRTRNDLLQLRALCDAADLDAPSPFSASDLSNQNTPAFVLQLNSVVQLAVRTGVRKGVLGISGLLPMANWDRAGRYMSFGTTGVAAWFGTDFRRWRDHGLTPLWLVFSPRRASAVRRVLEPWAAQQGLPTSVAADGYFGVGIDVAPGREQDEVVGALVRRLESVAEELARISAKPEATATGEQEVSEHAAGNETAENLVCSGS